MKLKSSLEVAETLTTKIKDTIHSIEEIDVKQESITNVHVNLTIHNCINDVNNRIDKLDSYLAPTYNYLNELAKEFDNVEDKTNKELKENQLK